MPLGPMTPDVASLDLFVKVVQLGSVGRAAAAVRISQPSATARLRGLERQLGVELLTRSPTGSVPTEAGTVVAEWAGDVLAAMDRLVVGAEALRGHTSEQLRVVSSYTIAEYLLPGWLASFRRRHPDARVQLEVANSEQAVERLRSGQVDLGFIETARVPRSFATRVVATDELVVAVSPDHPWARRARPLRPQAVASTALVVREPGSGTRQAFEMALAGAGLRMAPPVLELGSTAAIKRSVFAGVAPTVISRLTIEDDLASGRVVEVPVSGLDLRRRLRAAWDRQRGISDLGQELLERSVLSPPERVAGWRPPGT